MYSTTERQNKEINKGGIIQYPKDTIGENITVEIGGTQSVRAHSHLSTSSRQIMDKR